MILCSGKQAQVVERAQPWLGTVVSVRVQEMDERAAHGAIDAAFEEIAGVHRLMSFHDPKSDLGRLNRSGPGDPVDVHPHTYEVLRQALEISACSDGCFDVTVGAELAAWGLLPCPAEAEEVPLGRWTDVELLGGNRVVFHRPLWVDMGGIAKGFAVDRATECLRAHGALETVVNAGGDIRVQGACAEPIHLRVGPWEGRMPVLEVMDGSVASSSGELERRRRQGRVCGSHVDGRRRTPARTDRFVCVTAERCMIADALTKVVMTEGEESASLLRRFDASAYFHDPERGWKQMEDKGASAE